MPEFKNLMNSIGRAFADAGIFIGKTVTENYKNIDPDVIRHLSQAPLLSYSLFVSKRENIEPCEPDGYPPLIFVHGLGGGRGDFLPMSWYLWLLGRKRSYKIQFEKGQTISEQAKALANFIRDVKKATEERQVEIVAHSLGGIVARIAITDHRLGGSIKTLLTLGSPHRGTYPARYANTGVTKEIRPESELIKKLGEKPLPKNIRFISFWSRSDLFILPAESAAAEGAEQIDMTPFTHYSYLIDPESWKRVGKLLTDATHYQVDVPEKTTERG
ncbi:MAG: hypothetical protein Kow0090_06810 [Myxococcota bacterium]